MLKQFVLITCWTGASVHPLPAEVYHVNSHTRNGSQRKTQAQNPSTPWKRLFTAFGLLAVLWCPAFNAFASATDIYITQNTSGNNTGADPADAHSASWFNAAANWGSGAAQIGPGTTVHLVGTFTGTDQTTMLTFQGSGTASAYITLHFEPNCLFTSPGGWAAAIRCSGRSYLNIDGGSNGTITCTANGSGLAFQDQSIGIIAGGGSYINIHNLTITNLYQHDPNANDCETYNNGNNGGIAINGSSSYVHVYSNYLAMIDEPIAFSVPGGSDHFEIDHNTTYDAHWHILYAISGGSGNTSDLKIHDNNIQSWAHWGAPSSCYHQDGIFMWTATGCTLSPSIYNNYFAQPSGGSWSGFISLTYGNGVGNYGTVLIHNNVFVGSVQGAYADIWMYGGVFSPTTFLVANNTFVSGLGFSTEGASGPTPTMVNNIFYNSALNYLSSDTISSDYNVIYNSPIYGGFSIGSHSLTSNPLLNVNYTLQSGSPAIGKGENLSSYFTSDAAGSTYPSSGAWDIGAYQYGATVSSNPPSITTGLVGVTNNTVNGFTLTIGASGTSPLTYNWFFNGSQIQTGNSASYGSTPAATSQSGNYRVIVTNLYGAVTSSLVTVLITNAVTNFVPLSFSVTNAYGTLVANSSGVAFTITGNYLSQSVETADPTQGGEAIYWFYVTNPGNYVVSATVNCPDTSANSFFLNIDQPPTTNNIWDVYPLTTGWTNVLVSWRGVNADTNDQYSPVVFNNLTAGPHELILIGREAGAEISWLIVTNYNGSPPPPANPAIQVSPGSLAFGTILSGTSTSGSFTVKNIGGGTLSGAASVSAPFSIVSGGSYSLGSNQSQTVTVAFNPISAGNYNQNMTLTGGGGASVGLTGSATNAPVPAAIQVSPGSLAFGTILSGTSTSSSFTVKNIGGGTLSGAASVSAPFSIVSGGSYSLGSNQSQTVTVAFNPTSAGSYNQNVTLTGGGGASVGLTGSATNVPVPAAIQVSPGSLAFGTILSGTSTSGSFTVKNIGGGTLSGAASVSAPFSIVSGGSYSLGSNQSQTVTVAFNPTSAGSYNQNVTLTGGGGASVGLTGSATNVPVLPTVSAISMNVTDVDLNLAGLQVYSGTRVQLSATATNAQTWQWSYAVNGGSPVVYTNSTSPITNISYSFGTNTVGNSYVWTLVVSNGQAWAQSQTNLSVEAAPTGGTVTTNLIQGPTISATSGTLSGLLTYSTVINGVTVTYWYQPLPSIGNTSGGTATYNVTVTNAGNYEIQALVYAPSANANTLLVNFDGQPLNPTMIWDITPLTSGFAERTVSWRGNGSASSDQFVPMVFNLSAGPHQLIFVGGDPGTAMASFNLVQVVTTLQSPSQPTAPNGLRILASSP